DQPCGEAERERAGDFRFAHARFALDEQWPLQLQRDIEGCREAPVRDVALLREPCLQVVDGSRTATQCHFARSAAAVSARFSQTGATAFLYSAEAYRSPRMSGPRSRVISAAARAIASADSFWPMRAFSTEVARIGRGTSPPIATDAAVHLPP